MHHIHEQCHRELIYRALPRFSMGRSPIYPRAITTQHPPHSPNRYSYGDIRVERELPNKSDLYGIFVHMMYMLLPINVWVGVNALAPAAPFTEWTLSRWI